MMLQAQAVTVNILSCCNDSWHQTRHIFCWDLFTSNK